MPRGAGGNATTCPMPHLVTFNYPNQNGHDIHGSEPGQLKFSPRNQTVCAK